MSVSLLKTTFFLSNVPDTHGGRGDQVVQDGNRDGEQDIPRYQQDQRDHDALARLPDETHRYADQHADEHEQHGLVRFEHHG